jgi:hypothetical protein
MEALICQIPTVLRCAVTVNDWGSVEEIHVLTNTERSPKQIVRDIESALLAQWGLRIDHKCISVAQIVDTSPDLRVTYPRRLAILEYRMETDTREHQATAHVVLRWSDALDTEPPFEGQWTGHYVSSQYYHIMGWAAVDALNHLPEIPKPLVLLDLKTLLLAGRTVVGVALGYPGARRQDAVLIGAAEDRGDGHGASVRAVLDAVNRRIAQPLKPVF